MLDQSTDTSQDINFDALEPVLLGMPQMECKVAHHFGPGIYIREVTLPAGGLAMGHAQKFPHLNLVLSGSVAVIEDGEAKVIKAPLVFVGKPGRKIGYCIEECTWQNIYANPDNERDIETLERRYLDKSYISDKFDGLYCNEPSRLHDQDRKDFALMLDETGFTAEQVRAESEFELDMTVIPEQYLAGLSIRSSPIEGKGLFTSCGAFEGQHIAPAKISGMRTIAGRYVNHAKTPNCHYEMMPNGDIFLVASKAIHGASGGDAGCELTVDYREALKASGRIGVFE